MNDQPHNIRQGDVWEGLIPFCSSVFYLKFVFGVKIFSEFCSWPLKWPQIPSSESFCLGWTSEDLSRSSSGWQWTIYCPCIIWVFPKWSNSYQKRSHLRSFSPEFCYSFHQRLNGSIPVLGLKLTPDAFRCGYLWPFHCCWRCTCSCLCFYVLSRYQEGWELPELSK